MENHAASRFMFMSLVTDLNVLKKADLNYVVLLGIRTKGVLNVTLSHNVQMPDKSLIQKKILWNQEP